jgi:hypothetical protein
VTLEDLAEIAESIFAAFPNAIKMRDREALSTVLYAEFAAVARAPV